MATPQALREPPITEALIDFRIASDPGITSERLAGLRAQLPEYPNVEEKRQFQAELRVEAGKLQQPAMSDLGFRGMVFRNADGTRLVQFRRDGFTLNQLRPYMGADVLITEAVRLWEMYRAIVTPVSVTRIAFRYINSLALPYRLGDDFRRFLTAPPDMPEGTPQQVSGFLTRMVAHEDEDVVIVTQKLENVAPERPTPVTIDIDVFVPGEFDSSADSLVRVLGRLRVLKNRVFFGLLTDAAVELYV